MIQCFRTIHWAWINFFELLIKFFTTCAFVQDLYKEPTARFAIQHFTSDNDSWERKCLFLPDCPYPTVCHDVVAQCKLCCVLSDRLCCTKTGTSREDPMSVRGTQVTFILFLAAVILQEWRGDVGFCMRGQTTWAISIFWAQGNIQIITIGLASMTVSDLVV